MEQAPSVSLRRFMHFSLSASINLDPILNPYKSIFAPSFKIHDYHPLSQSSIIQKKKKNSRENTGATWISFLKLFRPEGFPGKISDS